MRKIALFTVLVGLALTLSSCLILVDLPVSNFRFKSNWQRTDTGEYVFCTNQPTRIHYRFRAPDSSVISSIEERYEGTLTERILTRNRSVNNLKRDGSDLFYEGPLTFGENTVPQSLPGGVSQQSIVVVATPSPSEVGGTIVTVTVTTISGSRYSGSYVYSVYSNCPEV